MRLKQLQDEVDEWVNSHGGYWSELSMYARLAEEVGELGEAVNVEHGGQTGSHDSLESEAADVLFTLAALCNELGIDMADAFEDMMEDMPD
jgi:NTP pyrophosphatase (non-canonical NTP hydrolase)